jgi:hypothetical protein
MNKQYPFQVNCSSLIADLYIDNIEEIKNCPYIKIKNKENYNG